MDFGLVWRLDLVIAWSELVISCLKYPFQDLKSSLV